MSVKENGSAVIYCRVSTIEQAEEGVSLAAQEKCCRAFCEKRHFHVSNVFIERGEPGRSTKRPLLQEMLTFCRHRRRTVDAIVVYKIDRLSRNKNSYFALQVHLRKYGINIMSATEPLDGDSPITRLMEGILASVSEFESDLISQRTSLSMEHARASGRIVHRPPLGYIKMKRKGTHSITVHDSERAPLMKIAFQMMASGKHTQTDILCHVTDLGLVTLKGAPLSTQSLRRMLENRTYAGWIRVSEEKGYVRSSFEPIVTDEVFKRVQVVLKRRRNHKPSRHKQHHPDFPLRGFVKCGKCGLPLTASWSKGKTKKYPYYRCRSSECSFGSIRKEVLEGEFLDLLKRLKPSREFISHLHDAIIGAVAVDKEKNRQKTQDSLDRIQLLEANKGKLRQAFIYDSVIDKETYVEEMDRLAEGILEIQISLDNMDELRNNIRPIIQHAGSVLLECDDLWLNGSSQKKIKLQTALFPSAVLFTGTLWVRTPSNPDQVSIYDIFQTDKCRMATPTGIEPVLPA